MNPEHAAFIARLLLVAACVAGVGLMVAGYWLRVLEQRHCRYVLMEQ